VAGDINTDSRGESAITTFKTFLSDSPVPTDSVSGGDPDTNLNRNKPYDYVLPSFTFAAKQTNVLVGTHSFPNGLVFDSRVYPNLAEASPVLLNDSANGQHMAVIKDFSVGVSGTNGPSAPTIAVQPQSQAVSPGGNVTFSVTANGASPLSYQWFFDSTNTVGANTNTFTVTNAQWANAGNYSVVVTNISGAATSAPALLAVLVPSQTSIIAQWNFNSVTPDASTSSGTTMPSTGAGTASAVGGVSPSFVGGSANDPASSGTDNSAWTTTGYPAQGTANKTAGVQFNVSTAGRQNIVITWNQRASSTGSKYVRPQYTTNGTAFIDFPTATSVASTSFESKTNNLAGIPAANNNSNFAFRIVAEFENTAAGTLNTTYVGATGTYGTGGTIRFDMMTVSGSVIPTNPPPQSAILSSFTHTNGGIQFHVTGSAGASYVIETSANLSASNWISVFTNASPFTFNDTNTGTAQKFYRAVAAP